MVAMQDYHIGLIEPVTICHDLKQGGYSMKKYIALLIVAALMVVPVVFAETIHSDIVTGYSGFDEWINSKVDIKGEIPEPDKFIPGLGIDVIYNVKSENKFINWLDAAKLETRITNVDEGLFNDKNTYRANLVGVIEIN